MRNVCKNRGRTQIGLLIKPLLQPVVREQGTGQEAIFTQAGLTSTPLCLKIAVKREGAPSEGEKAEEMDPFASIVPERQRE